MNILKNILATVKISTLRLNTTARPEPVEGSFERLINNISKQLATAIVNVGRLQLGFWDAPICLFEETCTRYSRRLIKEESLPLAAIKIIWRLASCNPINGIIRRFRKT